MSTIKTMIIGAAAALVATVSLASTAEAHWRKHHHHHRHHGHHHGYYVYKHHNYCFIKKVKRYDDWGNVYIKRIRVCPW